MATTSDTPTPEQRLVEIRRSYEAAKEAAREEQERLQEAVETIVSNGNGSRRSHE